MDMSSMEDVAISDDGEQVTVVIAASKETEIQENIPNGIEDKHLEESALASHDAAPENQHVVLDKPQSENKDNTEKHYYYDQEQYNLNW